MRKGCIAILIIGSFVSNAYALVSIGLRGGYAYESLTPKEIHYVVKYTDPDTSWTEDTTLTPTGEEAETKHPKGLGCELLCEISPPAIPVSVELNAGLYTTSFTEAETLLSTEYTYTINSIRIAAVGKYYIQGIPMISPWIGIGPFLGLNTHKIKMEEASMVFEGNSVPNFGLLVGSGVNIGIIPNLSLNAGILFNYFITSKGKFTQKYTWGNITQEATSETNFSQWNINFSVGMTYKIM